MFVDPGVLNGTPAIAMIKSFPEAKSNNLAALTTFITALLNRSTGVVTTQCNPKRVSFLAVSVYGVSAIVGALGLSRDASSSLLFHHE